MTLQSFIFFMFAGTLIASATMTIMSRDPVRSALFLVLSFFAAAALWILLTAEFLGLVLILVYVGAVMTLFLFVIMTSHRVDLTIKPSFSRYWPYALAIVLLFMLLALSVLSSYRTPSQLIRANVDNTAALGSILYTHYVYPFEIMGLLLLVGIIAAISLNPRVIRDRKQQDPSQQICVKPSDRIRLIKMKPSIRS